MTQFLPPNLLALFAARDPIPYLPPVERLSHEKRTTGYTGISDYLHYFEAGPAPPRPKYENKEERAERRRREKQEQVTYKLEQEIAMWDPSSYEKVTSDAFRSLFIGRVNFDTTESKLKREFESYGPIKKIILVKDKKSGKPRGYAFVEYEHERDMHSAFKHADGKKVEGKRILVDVERGRTVKGWLPRRLGGGLGGTRRGGTEVNIKISGREDPDRDRFRDDKKDDRRDRRENAGSKERNNSADRSRDRSGRRDRRRSQDRVERNPKDRTVRDRDRDKDKDKDGVRKRRRSRSRDRNIPEEEAGDRTRKRSRSRDKKRHRDRSGSRSKDKKRDKKDKEKDRERGDRGERKDRERKVKPEKFPKEEDITQIKIKEEPVDDYPSYDNYSFNNHENENENEYMKPEA